MESSGYVMISNGQLILSISLVLLAGLVSAFLKLGLLKSLLWGTLRAFIQLTLIGYVLTFVFNLNNIFVVIILLLLMAVIASREASRRIKKAPANPSFIAFIALTLSTFLVGSLVVGIIISPDPWYSPRVVIPIFGLILGNSMNGIALSLDRMYGEVNTNVAEVEQLLCLGASPWEAVQAQVRNAMRAGMTPIINSLMVVGVVSLPGIMTGQILAGMEPQTAVRYQFVILIMVAAAAAIGCLILIGLSYKKMFTDDMALVATMREN
ncbi:MAG TPA: iron export ABC transporter permease subunit FetB [Syntrophomonadaceae bacterium]|nr:iron export ABC transporter permease subunit FetB [Syntrophomonadaceae bacterium]